MPNSIVYLLFALGVVLVIGGIARPSRLAKVEKSDGLGSGERLRLGLYRHRGAGLIIGTMVILLLWFEVSSPSTPDSSAPDPAVRSPAAESAGHRMFESDFIQIKLPSDWTATNAFGLEIPDLDYSPLPRAAQVSISAIPMGNEDLHLFAFDGDYQATLVITSGDIEVDTVSEHLDRRWALYTWIGVPVAEMAAGLVINGREAGIMVLEPMHRFELFREKQYLVTTESQTYTLIFSTLADGYQEREPMFEDIAGSFRVLPES